MGNESAVAERYPVTDADLSVVLLRCLGMHDELGCRLVFAQHLDEAVLRASVRASLDVEPVLGCGLGRGRWPKWWQRLPDLDAHIPLTLLETEEPDAEWVRFAGGFIDDAGPQVAVQLTRSQAHDEIFVRISHVTADGSGAKNYAYLLARIYTCLCADPRYSPRPRGSRPCLSEHVVQITPEQQRAAKAHVDPGKAGEYFTFSSKGWTGGGRTIRERTIDAAAFGAIREYGRARGASVNDLLVTALLRGTAASFPYPEDKPMGVGFSVDLRQFYAPSAADRVANLPESLFMAVECPRGADFEDTLARVHARTAEMCEALWGLGAADMFHKMRPFMPAYGLLFTVIAKRIARRGGLRPSLSNLGVLEEERLSFAGATPSSAAMSGPVVWGAGQQLTVSTYRGVMTLSIGFCADDQEPEVIERVLDAIVGELSGCADAPPGQLASEE